MARSSIFVDFSLLKHNAHFRAIFVARMMSVFALGLLTVAVPVQIHQLTGSPLQVGLAMALDGAGMFVGLLCGGVLADRYDRRRLILLARGLCGLGFLLLALNSFIAAPSLLALYLVSLWDGFFGAMGITALMAVIPLLVGRENLPAAGALSMLTVRFGAVLAPAVGGLIIATLGVSWNYLLAGVGTLATLLALMRLPALPAHGAEPQHPLAALYAGLGFLRDNRVVGAVVLLGTLQALLSTVRVLFPALAEGAYGGGAAQVGLMYSAVPLGAMLGAFTSGWVGAVARPGALLMSAVLASALLVAALGLCRQLPLALGVLVLLGYCGSLVALLQFILVQGQTPDHLLGRVNSLWSAQDVLGDAVGALGIGALARWLAPLTGVLALGGATALLAVALGLACSGLRQLLATPPGAPQEADGRADGRAETAV